MQKTFLSLRSAARENPDIDCVAVFHSSQSSIDKWLDAVGGAGPLKIIIDADRKTYAQWGLGVSSFSHVLSPVHYGASTSLGKKRGSGTAPPKVGAGGRRVELSVSIVRELSSGADPRRWQTGFQISRKEFRLLQSKTVGLVEYDLRLPAVSQLSYFSASSREL